MHFSRSHEILSFGADFALTAMSDQEMGDGERPVEQVTEEQTAHSEPSGDGATVEGEKDLAEEELGAADDIEELEVEEEAREEVPKDKDPGNIDDLNMDYDPLLDDAQLDPILERRERSLKELLNSMDEYAPIIPDAVSDYYLSKAGFKTDDQRIKRLLALATQKFISDIATDAYQFSRIRSQTGGGRVGQANVGKSVLSMEDLSNVLTEYGINVRRPDFYR